MLLTYYTDIDVLDSMLMYVIVYLFYKFSHVQIVVPMTCIGQQLWEIQEGRFGSPVPSDVVSILASELGISTDMLEFEKIVQRHNVSNRTCFVTFTPHTNTLTKRFSFLE